MRRKALRANPVFRGSGTNSAWNLYVHHEVCVFCRTSTLPEQGVFTDVFVRAPKKAVLYEGIFLCYTCVADPVLKPYITLLNMMTTP